MMFFQRETEMGKTRNLRKLKKLDPREPDGSDNHPEDHGQAGDLLRRVTENSYADGKGEIDLTLPAPRLISDKIMAQPKDAAGNDIETGNTFGVNEYFQFFGQFVTHDVQQAPGQTPAVDAPIFLDGLAFPFGRSAFTTDENGVRQQTDEETSFFDLSPIYGHNQAMLDLLRDDIVDAAGNRTQSARLLTGADGENRLPTATEVAADSGKTIAEVRTILGSIVLGPDTGADFASGDNRLNQQGALIANHTLWVREHNHHVDRLAEQFPEWTQEQLFQTARAITEAEWQHVVYDEYLPKLLGENALADYKGYRESVDPRIINEWTAVAFRFGHDQSSNLLTGLEENGSQAFQITLGTAFALANASQAVRTSDNFDDWVRGLTAQESQEIDGKVVDGNRNLLFGAGATIDLEVLDIMRARDHGVGNYNTLRDGLGLETYDSLDAFAAANAVDAATLAALKDVYGSEADGKGINILDSLIGGLLETKVEGSQLGETFQILTVMQFEALRDGDRAFYLERLAHVPGLIEDINATSLAEIIQRNSGIDYVYHDAFAAHTRIAGDGGNNSLIGTSAADLLIGFAGNDVIRAGDGKDDIHGGAGNDNLWGGAGADLFVFGPASGSDRINDFNVKQDRIDLSDCGFDSILDVVRAVRINKAGVVLELDDATGDSVQLVGVRLIDLSAKNFVLDNHDIYSA
jgi:peroxidase